MSKLKVKAFTIMEATVAMLIAAIVIGITYTVYTIVVRSYVGFNDRSRDMAVLIRLDELLKKDFDRSEIILKDADGLVFRNADQSITYEIKPDRIVRTSGIIDTFSVKIEEFGVLFEKQAVTGLNSDEEDNCIDELQLSIIAEKQKIPYHYHKQYSSASLIKRKANAVN